MNQQIEKKLQSMLNKPLKYGIQVITFTGYELNEEKEKLYIHTNVKDHHFERPYDSAMVFLKEFAPNDVHAKDTSTEVVISNTNNITENLREVLLDNIKKVQQDKAYIPQATAINNNVNSIINLSKLEMDAIKMSQKFKHA